MSWLQNPSWWPLHSHSIHTTTLSSDVTFLDPKPSAPQSRLLKRRNFVDCSSLLLLLPTPTMECHTCRFKHGQLSFFFGLLTWLYFLDTDKVQMEGEWEKKSIGGVGAVMRLCPIKLIIVFLVFGHMAFFFSSLWFAEDDQLFWPFASAFGLPAVESAEFFPCDRLFFVVTWQSSLTRTKKHR